MNQHYKFIEKVNNEPDTLYKPYFDMAVGYVTNVIWLTNSLLLILISYFIEKKIEPPNNSMVGSFIQIIKTKQIDEMNELVPSLKAVANIVNLVKHSLIMYTSYQNETTMYLWDLKTRQQVLLSQDAQKSNLVEIRTALSLAKEKLSELQNKKRGG